MIWIPIFSMSARGRWTSRSDAQQARRGIRRALAAEVAAGDLTERQAMAIATRIMRANQYATPMRGLTDRAVGA